MTPPTLHTIPARHSHAIPLRASQSLKIHNTHGTQVVDTWAFTLPTPLNPLNLPPSPSPLLQPPSAWMSMSQTRSSLRKLTPQPGDTLVTNHCAPVLTLTEDESPGVHDTLFPACNVQRYAHLPMPHRSCAENCREAAEGVGIGVAEGEVPDPLNLFMNVVVEWGDEGGGRGIRLERPVTKGGEWVVLRAEVGCVVVLSACPNDVSEVNGGVCRDVLYEVF